MTTPTQLANAAVWQHLDSLAAPIHGPSRGTSLGTDHLPTVSPNLAEWSAFTASKTNIEPYRQDLEQSLATLRDFIQTHAAPGAQKNAALASLHDFLSTRVDCKASALTPTVLNENRRNLRLIAGQLQNTAIPVEQRIAVALSLTEGLNVCAEGTCLNILNCASQLIQSQQGFAGLIVRTKNELIDQHLLKLVRQQDSRNLSNKLATGLEIHHVQALKNHVADHWGLQTVSDRYATTAYQQQAGAMAQALLEQTLTPRALAEVIADRLANDLTSHTSSQLRCGLPSDQLKTGPLLQALQAEYGQDLELQQCLEFTEDYSQVKLQPQEALMRHVLELFQKCGLVPADAAIDTLMASSAVTLDQALEDCQRLRGPTESSLHARPPLWNMLFWSGAILNDAKAKEEERQQTQERTPH